MGVLKITKHNFKSCFVILSLIFKVKNKDKNSLLKTIFNYYIVQIASSTILLTEPKL